MPLLNYSIHSGINNSLYLGLLLVAVSISGLKIIEMRKRQNLQQKEMTTAFEKMDKMYRHQRYFYDLTRKYYLLGRDRLINEMKISVRRQCSGNRLWHGQKSGNSGAKIPANKFLRVRRFGGNARNGAKQNQ